MFRRAIALLVLAAASILATGCGAGGAISDVLDGAGGGGGGGNPPAATMSQDERAWAMQVFNSVNTERARVGVAALAWNEAAAAAAYAHAVDMDARNFFDHDNPDGQGPGPRLAAQGITSRGWGENIAMGQRDPAAVMADWMASTGHRRNILEPAYVELGVGVHFGKGGPWWVQDFLAR